MNRIKKKFQQLKREKKKALIPYITPEFPVKGVTVPLTLALEQAGADFIEIGIPFSDPLADGKTIQHSSTVALRNGVTTKKILEWVKEIRRESEIPILLMGYVNPLLNYGLKNFFREAASVGVDGLIVPDLPPEEADEIIALSRQQNISNVFLIAPTSSKERIEAIDRLSTDFSYCISVTGVTGVRQHLSENSQLKKFLKLVKEYTEKPFVVGFGISKREDMQHVCRYADGAVVGSALMNQIAGLQHVRDVVKIGSRFLRELQN